MVKAITIFLCLLCSNIQANQTIDHSKEIDKIIANDLKNKSSSLKDDEGVIYTGNQKILKKNIFCL